MFQIKFKYLIQELKTSLGRNVTKIMNFQRYVLDTKIINFF